MELVIPQQNVVINQELLQVDAQRGRLLCELNSYIVLLWLTLYSIRLKGKIFEGTVLLC